jgi:NAD(P)H-hydrate epimerase
MTSGYTARQVRDAEAPHLAAGEPLMQRAAHGLATEIGRVLAGASGALGASGEPEQERERSARGVLLLVGSGDNGGDALFAGAELAAGGAEVRAIGVGSRMHGAGGEAARAAGVRFVGSAPEALPALLRETAVIVDGILGTGTTAGSPALRGAARELVLVIRRELAATPRDRAEGSTAPLVVAVDIPSGIDPDSGETADDVVLAADLTVTFGGVKAGLLRGQGPRLAGDVVLVEIGIEGDLAAVEPAIRT